MGGSALRCSLAKPRGREDGWDENVTILQPSMIQADITSRRQEEPTPPTSIPARNPQLIKSLEPSYKNGRIRKKPYHGHIVSNTQLWKTLKDNQLVSSGKGGDLQVRGELRARLINSSAGPYLDSDSN